MLEILKFCLSGFWIFIGSVFLISIVLGIISECVVKIVRSLTGKYPPIFPEEDDDKNDIFNEGEK